MAKTQARTALGLGRRPLVPLLSQPRGSAGSRASTGQHFPCPRALPRLGGSLCQRRDLCIHLFLMDLFSTEVSERKGTISLRLPALFIISARYTLPARAP